MTRNQGIPVLQGGEDVKGEGGLQGRSRSVAWLSQVGEHSQYSGLALRVDGPRFQLDTEADVAPHEALGLAGDLFRAGTL